MHVLQEGGRALESIVTNELPYMDDGQESVMLLPNVTRNRDVRAKHRDPLPLNLSSRQTTPIRVGCIDSPTTICLGHYSPNCKPNVLVDIETIIPNFDALNVEDRAQVPDISYRCVIVLVNTSEQF